MGMAKAPLGKERGLEMLEFLRAGFEIPITTLILQGSGPQCHRLQRFGHPLPLSSPRACVCSQSRDQPLQDPPGTSGLIPALQGHSELLFPLLGMCRGSV